MEVIKSTKYLVFYCYIIPGKKTQTVSIVNIHHNREIGVIKWYPAWRQYCFFPDTNTIWNKTCLADVNEVLEMLNVKKQTTGRQKTVGVVAFNVENFNHWKALRKHTPEVGNGARNTLRTYVFKNKRYVCLSRANDGCGYTLDEVVETGRAKVNPEYQEILSNIRPTLSPGGKWLGKKLSA